VTKSKWYDLTITERVGRGIIPKQEKSSIIKESAKKTSGKERREKERKSTKASTNNLAPTFSFIFSRLESFFGSGFFAGRISRRPYRLSLLSGNLRLRFYFRRLFLPVITVEPDGDYPQKRIAEAEDG